MLTPIGKFYVFNPAMDKPRKIYDTYEEAYKDAKEIAYKYDSIDIYVLEIVTVINRTELVKTEIHNTAAGKVLEEIDPKIPF